MLQIDKNTVSNYIDLLEKVFVIFRLPAFSRNMRKEISRSKKIYFYDNGVRNAVISNFQPFSLRADKGALWENFLISERIKTLHYNLKRPTHYFWRTTDQREIDLIEETSEGIYAFEFKWDPKSKVRISKSFEQHYNTSVSVIHQGNYFDFIEKV
jgi:hypothetical protein